MNSSAPPSQPPAVIPQVPAPPLAPDLAGGRLRRAARYLVCRDCGGSGRVERLDELASGAGATLLEVCPPCGGAGRFKLSVAPPPVARLPRHARGNLVNVWGRLSRSTQLALLGCRRAVRRDDFGRPSVGHLRALDVARLDAWCRAHP